MAQHLPPHYIELVCDATLKSFWRRHALLLFLRRCGISKSFLATWAPTESKRILLNRLFPELESSSAGIRTINRIADALIQQTSFPDLDGWEDSDLKKEMAREAIEALTQFRSAQLREAEKQRTEDASRMRIQALQQEAQKKEVDLQKFSDRLVDLSRRLGTPAAGYAFQEWFYDLMDFFEVTSRRPYVAQARQIDGSVTIDGTTYLVELKFTQEGATAEDVDSLYRKVTSKADNTMGIMVSMSGFTSVAIGGASGAKTPLLLLDSSHIYMILNNSFTFEELVGRVRRHCSQTGEAYLKAQDFGG